MPLQADRFVFLSKNEQYLFLLCDGSDGLVDDFEFFQGLRRGVQLPQAAIDQHQTRKLFSLGLQAGVAAPHGFAHAGEIVVAPFAANNEFAIVRLFHVAVLPYDHGGHGVGALNMGDVETLDPFWSFGQVERGSEPFSYDFRAWFQHTKTLFERVTRVFLHEIEECMFGAALRRGDLHPTVGKIERCRTFG
jgi:hypothetical protein